MMKKRMIWAVAGLMALSACQQAPGYVIQGTATGAADGDTIFLQNFDGANMIKMDSAIVKNGTFEFKGMPDSLVESRYVTYMKGDNRMSTMLFVEKGNIQVTLDPENSKVSGTPNNDILQQFSDMFAAISKDLNDTYRKCQMDSTLTEEQKDSVEQVLDRKQEEGLDKVFNMVTANIDKPVGVYLLASFGPSFDVKKMQPLFKQIPAAYSSQPEIVSLKEYVETAAKTAEGETYIDFTMNTPEGNPVKLSDYVSKNTYTLIDFWASWCGPCKKEMPTVVEAYAKYKGKGLGVVGVSLDNNAESWKQAIKDLQITWPQMSDLKGWQCEGAALYGVRAIPATVLVDQQGTIIARNLRGFALMNKLDELMK